MKVGKETQGSTIKLLHANKRRSIINKLVNEGEENIDIAERHV